MVLESISPAEASAHPEITCKEFSAHFFCCSTRESTENRFWMQFVWAARFARNRHLGIKKTMYREVQGDPRSANSVCQNCETALQTSRRPARGCECRLNHRGGPILRLPTLPRSPLPGNAPSRPRGGLTDETSPRGGRGGLCDETSAAAHKH